ncbi:MAG: H-NS family nucleoid-associated regulatory protein [Vogesella sp.]|uniref:H-NS family nucleoid-associated regulatory protein n=1 Tax=Vogesella sp. TaxID=1904252 RepID=UPI00391BD24D
MTHGQTELNFTMPGQAAAHLVDAGMRRRILADAPGRTSTKFYIAQQRGHLMTWRGHGQMPAWVAKWLADGGLLAELEITIKRDA